MMKANNHLRQLHRILCTSLLKQRFPAPTFLLCWKLSWLLCLNLSHSSLLHTELGHSGKLIRFPVILRCIYILYGHVPIHITIIPLLLGTLKLIWCASEPHRHSQPTEKQRDQALPLTHWTCKHSPPHTHSSATAPSLRAIFYSYLCDKTKPNCLKQLENRPTPFPLYPPSKKNRKQKIAVSAKQALNTLHSISLKQLLRSQPRIT